MTSYLLVGPAIEPVTLAETKIFLRVDNSAEDGFISTLITAARLHVEGTTGRAMIAQTWRVVCDEWPKNRKISLPVAPILSISAINAYDGDGVATSISLAQFQPETNVSPACIIVPSKVAGAPNLRQHNGIEIDYVAGFGPVSSDIPADLRQALMSLIGYWFEHRDAVVIAGSGAIVPAGFDQLIASYRSIGL